MVTAFFQIASLNAANRLHANTLLDPRFAMAFADPSAGPGPVHRRDTPRHDQYQYLNAGHSAA